MEGLFGNPIIEKILFSLFVYGDAYPLGMARNFDEPVNRFQQQLKRLEDNSIVVSRLIGKVRLYTFNPRYPFLKELKALIEKAYGFLPEKEKEKYYDLFENSPDMYFKIAVESMKILDCNKKSSDTLGYAKKEFIGKPITKFYLKNELESVLINQQQFLKNNQTADQEQG